MASGFYNHLDDPDEFWDDEPLVPQRSKAAQPDSAPPLLAPKPSSTHQQSVLPRVEGVKASYGPGIEGIRAAIGDASTKDGDKSDWTVGQ